MPVAVGNLRSGGDKAYGMTIYNVSNATQLQAALGKAIGGDRIVLASGDYGSVNISGRNYASTVTIQAQNFTNRAHLDGLFVDKSSNLTFSGLDVGRAVPAGQTPEWTQLNYVYDSSNIRMNGVQFHGSVDGNVANDGVGLVVTRVNGFTADYSTFHDLYRGAYVQQSTNVTIRSNSFDNIRSDGLTFGADRNVVIDGNSFTNFHPVLGDHADGIQFWNTSQTSGSANVTIRNNVIAPGQFSGVEGTGVQGIWISDAGPYGYQNFVIQNNLIYTHGAWNGIGVSGGSNFQILGNTLLSQSGDNKSVWIRGEDMTSLVIKDNVAEDIMLRNVNGLIQTHNIDLSEAPALRGLIPNVDHPRTLLDLSVAGYGYHLPPSSTSAAATTVLGDASQFFSPQHASAMMFDHFTALP